MHGVLLDTSTPSGGSIPWAAVALGILTIVYIAFVRPLKKKQQKDPLARPGDSMLAQQRAMERDMTALLVEYEQMMRTMTAQLETRVVKLEVLLADADARIAALKAGVNAAPPAPAKDVQTPALRLGHMRLGGTQIDSRAPDSSHTLSSDIGFIEEQPAPPHGEVYALADEGLSYRQIAQKLDRPYGEIELIVALRPKSLKLAGTEEDAPTTNQSDAFTPASIRLNDSSTPSQRSTTVPGDHPVEAPGSTSRSNHGGAKNRKRNR